MERVPLRTVGREWMRIGLLGFGGPPAHVALLRELVVDRRRWLDAETFEDAIAACALLPGPASTQLAIFCAHRVAGAAGAIVGGLGFVTPAVLIVIALSTVFLSGAPPEAVLGAGAGAGAVVSAVAVQAGAALLGPSWERVRAQAAARSRWIVYVVAGAAAAVLVGPWLALVLVACGLAELLRRHSTGMAPALAAAPVVVAVASAGGVAALMWTAFKVGALSYGGGFVIIPLMQQDAVDVHHWMTDAEFLNAVALGQVTPGPVVATVAAVGYAARGVGGGLLAAAVAFAPSFLAVLLGGDRFELLRANPRARAFLDGAGPAAIGAILGSAVLLALALTETWQFAVLAAGLVAVLALRRGVVTVLLAGAAIGVAAALAGAPLP